MMEGEMLERVRFNIPKVGDRDRDRIEDTVSGLEGVRSVTVQPGVVEVAFDPREISVIKLQSTLISAGYHIDSQVAASPADVAGGSSAP